MVGSKEGKTVKLDKKALEDSLLQAAANACAITELLSAVRTEALEDTQASIISEKDGCYNWIREHYDVVSSAANASDILADAAHKTLEAAYMSLHFSEDTTSSKTSFKAGGPLDIVGMVEDALADADSIRLILESIEDTGTHFRSLCHASTSIPPETAEDFADEMQHFSAIADDYRQKVEATLREVLAAVKRGNSL